MPDGAYEIAIPSPALEAQDRAALREATLIEIPFEFVVDRCQSGTLKALLDRRRVIDRAKPIARVFLRADRFYAEISFNKGPGLIVALDVWAWESKR